MSCKLLCVWGIFVFDIANVTADVLLCSSGICVTVKARRLVNPSIYHSDVVKVRKMFVNASISGLYQTISVNDSIYEHQLAVITRVSVFLIFNYSLNM
jgi:hypothetical protein